MLSRVALANSAGRALRPHMRGLCVPAVEMDQVQLLEKLRSCREMLKDATTDPTSCPYDMAKIKADLDAGTMDQTKLKDFLTSMDGKWKKDLVQFFGEDPANYPEALKELDADNDPLIKICMHMNQQIIINKQETPVVKEIDWDAWEAKITSPGLVSQMKKMYLDHSEPILQSFKESGEKRELDSVAEIKRMYNGSDGIHEAAKIELKKINDDLLESVSKLDDLEKQIEGVDTLTVAEFLEYNPKLRKDIEDQISSHNWAP